MTHENECESCKEFKNILSDEGRNGFGDMHREWMRWQRANVISLCVPTLGPTVCHYILRPEAWAAMLPNGDQSGDLD